MHSCDTKTAPYISVVIPTRNNPVMLGRSLRRLLEAADPLCGWEVIVVDNSDSLPSRQNEQVVADLASTHIRRVLIPAYGLMAARHVGARHAHGDVLAFLDDDAFVGREWLLGLHDAFSRRNAALATGPVLPMFEVGAPSWLEAMWSESPEGRFLPYLSLLDFGFRDLLLPAEYAWGCNMAVRRALFFAVRGTHPDYLPAPWQDFQGDGELGLTIKLSAIGLSAHYVSACSIEHFVPAERLGGDYLGSRAFFAGLHASYTHVRAASGLDERNGTPGSARTAAYDPTLVKRLLRTGADAVRARVPALGSARRNRAGSEAETLKALQGAAWRAGWCRHQDRTKTDSVLLRWVLLPHYMGRETSLPGMLPHACLPGVESDGGIGP